MTVAARRGLIVAAAAVLLAVIIYFSIKGGSSEAEKVYAEPVKVQKLEAVVTAPGEVDPKFKVNISAHVIGKIEHLYFNEGDTVSRGQKLIDLEKPSFTAARDSVRAQLETRRVEVGRAKSQLDTAEAAFKRAQSLLGQGIQAQEAFDQARQNLDNARAGYAAAQQGVQQTAAALVQSETDLSYTTITAPTTGKVVQLNTREGEVVIPGTMNNPGSVLAIIADMSQILVEAEVGETEVIGITIGLPAKIHVDAIPDKEYAGHVTEIGSSAAVHTGSASGLRYFKVKVAFDDADDRLRPGMTSQVSIVTSTSEKALTVPIQSVVERVPGAKSAEDDENADANSPKKKYVFIVVDNAVKQREVTTGISDTTRVAITSGVKEGDKVVTGPVRALKKLHDGDAVELTTEKKTSSADAKSDKEK
ncbi:MAG TPA: efflux RND transporter periplasmic adaptor subunit [Thermoanaerobaculia bacterium]|nr:efflux RND transporter periplasmic adaptor subunit [Thermoanaerobaculia bacterium]